MLVGQGTQIEMDGAQSVFAYESLLSPLLFGKKKGAWYAVPLKLAF